MAAAREKILLLDIDKTLIDDEEEFLRDRRVVWNGGGVAIWCFCIAAAKAAGVTVVGLATLRPFRDEISTTIEAKLSDHLDKDYIYYDITETRDKVTYALAQAAITAGCTAKDICLIDDQSAICDSARQAGYLSVWAIEVLPLKVKEYGVMRQQLKIISLFQQAISQLQLAPSPLLAKRKIELELLIAVYDKHPNKLKRLLRESATQGITLDLNIRDFNGWSPLLLAENRDFSEGIAILQGARAVAAAPPSALVILATLSAHQEPLLFNEEKSATTALTASEKISSSSGTTEQRVGLPKKRKTQGFFENAAEAGANTCSSSSAASEPDASKKAKTRSASSSTGSVS